MTHGKSHQHFSILIGILTAFLFFGNVFGQNNQSNVKFTQADVNENATLSLGVPLGSYPGRGLDLPVSLSYSSTVWRIEHLKSVSNYIAYPGYGAVKQSVTQALYSEYSTAGWKSSLDLPKIEFPKLGDVYDYRGQETLPEYGNGCYGYRIARVFIHMPDGATHELRKSDQPYQNASAVDMTGTFYAIDGSRMRYDSTGVDTGTLYMADGTRYVLGHPTSTIIDRNGNTQTYNETSRQWTDTLGRVITNPIPVNPQAQDYSYTLPGLNGGSLSYTFKWRTLSTSLTPDANNNTPALRVVAGHYLPSPNSLPTDSNQSNFPQTQSTQYQNLFHSEYLPDEDAGNPAPFPVPTLVVGKGQAASQLFNPVVLAEVVLPNGLSYKFSYNVYGEVDKVVYPTNAYEKYEYDGTVTEADQFSQPYTQAQRKIKSRKLSIDATGNDILEWKYSEVAPNTIAGYRVTSIIAPDKTRTEIYKNNLRAPGDITGKVYWAFGLSDATNGEVIEKKFYSTSSDGLGGQLKRREITQSEQTNNSYQFSAQCGQQTFTKTINAYRNSRPSKTVSLVFEGSGSALAQTSTFAYDTTYQLTTGVDQNLASGYNFAVVDNTTAQTGTIGQIPTGSLARYNETTYLNDPIYRNANILGLQTVLKVKNAAGAIVSQSEMLFDETGYSPAVGRANPTSDRVWDSTKGLVTNPSAYLVTHATFDNYGNRTIATDALGNSTTTTYDATYQAFPVSVMSVAPDQNGGTYGSTTGFTTSIAYDTATPPLGLPMSTTDANGQTTTIEYDAYLRQKKVIPPSGAGTAETIYNDTPGNLWVKARTQIDTNKWAESITYIDGLGRAFKSEQVDLNGNIFVETEFDAQGRVSRVTNPFRANETKIWTTNVYDEASRIKEIVLPDTSKVITDYGVAITGTIGVTKQITDQAGKKRKGITDALGRMIQVIEDPTGQNLNTDYVFDTLGNLRKTTQGEQTRYFTYDSLGRLLYAKQPEQEVNTALVATDAITGNSQWSVKYTYDNNGNIITTTDARGVSITGTYDHLNRLTYRDYSDATPDVSFYYDGRGLGAIPNFSKGKTTKVASSVSETRYTGFDNLGRLLTSEQRTPFGSELAVDATPRVSSYQYNLSGALVQETYPSGRVVKNEFDADGTLSRVSGNAAGQTEKTYANSFNYNSSGAIASLRLGNGKWETSKYNNRLQVTEIGLGSSATNTGLLKLSYDYGNSTENNGSMKTQTMVVPNVGANNGFTAVQNYTYDSLNRIQSAQETVSGSQTWKQTFQYDRYGNRKFDAANTTTLSPSAPSKVTNPLINTSDNRLKKDQDNDSITDYDFDKNGNLTLDAENKRFVYDAENHQTKFFAPTNNTSTPDATYLYDGEGKRVKKISNLETVVFVYNGGGQLVAEYSTQTIQTPQTSYLTSDHLGSPRIITNQLGAVTSRKDFAAFGDETITAQRTQGLDYKPDEIRQDYTGYQKDDESGFEYAQARYYNSSHGRFTSVDSLTASANVKNPQTLNRYSYALNSPYKFTDPLGLISDPAFQGCGEQTKNPSPCRPRIVRPNKSKSDSLINQSKSNNQRRSNNRRNNTTVNNTTVNNTTVNNTTVNNTTVNNTTVNNTTVIIDNDIEKIETVAPNAEALGVVIAKRLNEGYFEGRNIIEIGLIGAGGNLVKAATKEIADAFNPQISVGGGVSGGTDTSVSGDASVSIDLPSPGPVIQSLIDSGVDSGVKFAANQIQTNNAVNLILANAYTDARTKATPGEITPALIKAIEIGERLHKEAINNSPRR